MAHYPKRSDDIQEHITHLRFIAEGKAFTAKDTTEMLKSPDAVNALKALESTNSTCRFWSRRVTTYLERTNIRINLVSSKSRYLVTGLASVYTDPDPSQMHHLLAQNTSTLATDVALQTQRDSESLFTLAMVTAVFLPGTFVCVCYALDLSPPATHLDGKKADDFHQSVLSTTFFSYGVGLDPDCCSSDRSEDVPLVLVVPAAA